MLKKWSEIKLIKQYLNGKLLIGASGDKEKITEFSNQIFNYGGTNSELNCLSNEFLYFSTEEKRFQRAISAILKDAGHIAKSKLIKDFIEDIEIENFIGYKTTDYKFYQNLKEYN